LIQAPWDMETISGVKGVCLRIDTSTTNTVDLGTALWRMEARGMLLGDVSCRSW
jgi:hypothetical protein